MNDQLARSLFMDYLYDEISAEDKQKLENYLKHHPSLQEELDQLQQTRSLLQKMPAEEPAQKLLVMEPNKRSFAEWWQDAKSLMPQTGWGKTVFAAAASFLLLIIAGAAAEVQFSNTTDGFTLSMGHQAQQNQGISAEQAEALLTQIRQENAAMLVEYAESMNEQNRQQLQQVVQYFEQQRMNDLQLIDQNLDQFHQANNYRWEQANEFLGDVLQTVSLDNQQ